MGIPTDSTPVEAPKSTEDSLILDFYRLFASGDDVAQMEADFHNGGVGYGDFKKRLFEAYWEYFAPMRARRAELLDAPEDVEKVLKIGAEKARNLATSTLNRVRHAVGLT